MSMQVEDRTGEQRRVSGFDLEPGYYIGAIMGQQALWIRATGAGFVEASNPANGWPASAHIVNPRRAHGRIVVERVEGI